MDDLDESSSSTDGEDEESGDVSPCEVEGGACVGAVPDGWSGPAIVHTAPPDHPLPECPPDYPNEGPTLFDGLSATAAECDCECGEATQMECEPAQVGLWKYGCEDEPDEAYEAAPDECLKTDTLLLNPRVGVEPLQASGGSCEPIPTAEVPAAAWSERTVLCTAEPVDPCEGGHCVAPPAADFDTAICIFTPGDTQCPAGYDEDRRVVYTEVSDTRGCTACTCGGPVGTCSGTVELHGNGWCGSKFGDVGPDECTASIPVTSLRFSVEQVAGVCAPSASQPQGAAAPAGAITVCCQAA